VDRNSPDYKRIEQEMGMPPDAESIVSFSICAELNNAVSEELQRPIFEDHIYFVHRLKGHTDFMPRRAKDEDFAEYPREWAHFQATKHDTPITSIPGVTPSEVEMLRCRKIHTVRAAAELNDPHPEIANAVLNARRWMAIMAGEKPRIKLAVAG
jgi:hypothetical protein